MSSATTKTAVDERVIALVIHGFTIAHMIAAGISGPMAGPILTPMTLTMLFVIGRMCEADAGIMKQAANFMTKFVGFILGVSIAEFILGLFPGIGNLANAIATGIVTEFLGWSCFIALTCDITGWGLWKMIRKAYRKWKDNGDFINSLKEARKAMSPNVRERYDSLMKIITDKKVPDEQRQSALNEAQQILGPYGISFSAK